MSDEPTERDVTPLLTAEERRAILSARSMASLTLLMVVDTIKAEARREGAAEVGSAVEAWASKNEIAAPPLDWAWLWEITAWARGDA